MVGWCPNAFPMQSAKSWGYSALCEKVAVSTEHTVEAVRACSCVTCGDMCIS